MDVAEVDLSKLGTAVTDWKKTVDNLLKLSKSANEGMVAKAESAHWAGDNASATKAFIKKTAKEFADAHAEAQSVWQLLDDAHVELLKIQKSLQTAIDVDAPSLGVRIEDIGGGAVRWFFPHVRGDSDEHTQEQRDSAQQLADRVAGYVAHAMEIDASMTRALGKTNSHDLNNFSADNYASLDDAETARALELAKLGPKMSDKQYAELNSIMKYNSKDPEFSDAFYRGLGGPKQALEFFGHMSIDSAEHHVGDKTRLGLTQELQRNMGLTLATATDPDGNPGYLKGWSAEFRKLGTQKIQLEQLATGTNSPPYGYQLLGGILRYGNYDPEFLNPIAEHVTQMQKKDPAMFADAKGVYGENLYNPSGKDGAGYDPVVSVLEALGNSPEASKEFFTADPTAYNDDGTVKAGAPDLGKSTNYLDYFTDKDYQGFPGDLNPPQNHNPAAFPKAASEFMPDALGHALESATIGLPYGSDGPTPPHSAESAQLVHDIIDKFGGDPGLVDRVPMSDSLGNITAEYMRDVQDGLNGPAVIPTHGENANLGVDPNDPSALTAGTLKHFLGAVGKDPDAYGAIINAQQAVTTDLVNDAFADRKDYGNLLSTEVNNRVAPGADIAGIMAESRTQAVYDDKIASDAKFNEGVATANKWAGRAIGMGIGHIPVGGDAVGWVVEDVQESVVKHYTRDSSSEAAITKENFLENQRYSSGSAAHDATYTAAIQAGYDPKQAETMATSAGNAVLTGYGLRIK
ncbi:hypothetical protein [Streptomyces sp. NPDC005408]|uniref:hypothetical protein n=1 Tax=Streptomyces sp. NPDC005408 TaxID=3155341 RepID=UPI0033A1AFF2